MKPQEQQQHPQSIAISRITVIDMSSTLVIMKKQHCSADRSGHIGAPCATGASIGESTADKHTNVVDNVTDIAFFDTILRESFPVSSASGDSIGLMVGSRKRDGMVGSTKRDVHWMVLPAGLRAVKGIDFCIAMWEALCSKLSQVVLGAGEQHQGERCGEMLSSSAGNPKFDEAAEQSFSMQQEEPTPVLGLLLLGPPLEASVADMVVKQCRQYNVSSCMPCCSASRHKAHDTHHEAHGSASFPPHQATCPTLQTCNNNKNDTAMDVVASALQGPLVWHTGVPRDALRRIYHMNRAHETADATLSVSAEAHQRRRRSDERRHNVLVVLNTSRSEGQPQACLECLGESSGADMSSAMSSSLAASDISVPLVAMRAVPGNAAAVEPPNWFHLQNNNDNHEHLGHHTDGVDAASSSDVHMDSENSHRQTAHPFCLLLHPDDPQRAADDLLPHIVPYFRRHVGLLRPPSEEARAAVAMPECETSIARPTLHPRCVSNDDERQKGSARDNKDKEDPMQQGDEDDQNKKQLLADAAQVELNKQRIQRGGAFVQQVLHPATEAVAYRELFLTVL